MSREYTQCLLNRLLSRLDTMNIKGHSKLVDEIKSFSFSPPLSPTLHVVYPSSIVDLFKTLASIDGELEEKENKKLTVGRIFVLHSDTT